jgi:hypothetical protein
MAQQPLVVQGHLKFPKENNFIGISDIASPSLFCDLNFS